NGGLLHRFHPPDPVLVAAVSRSGIRSPIRSAAGRSGNGDTTLARLLRLAIRSRVPRLPSNTANRDQCGQRGAGAPTVAAGYRSSATLRAFAGWIASTLA